MNDGKDRHSQQSTYLVHQNSLPS